MWDKSSVVKPALRIIIGVSILTPKLFNASVMIYIVGIVGDTFDKMIRFDWFSNLRIGII